MFATIGNSLGAKLTRIKDRSTLNFSGDVKLLSWFVSVKTDIILHYKILKRNNCVRYDFTGTF